MTNTILQLLSALSTELKVILIAAMPIIELRGAIPVGIGLGMSPLHAGILGFLGSLIPVPFILFGIRPVFNYLKKTKRFKNFVEKITHKSMKKSDKIQRYGAWGLLIFVAIPLPGTGVWSGSLIAALLDMRFKWAFPAITVGNAIAGFLIMTLSYGVFRLI